MNPLTLYGWALGVLLAGACITFLAGLKTRRIGGLALLFAAVGTGLALAASVLVFVRGTAQTTGSLFIVPGLGAALTVRLDYLSAFFLGAIALVSFLVTLYSQRYMLIPRFADLSPLGYYPVLLFFFAGTMSVVGMTDMFFFFIAWEFMTLASYALVIYDRKRGERLRAGFKYFLITHIATGLMLLGAIIIFVYGRTFSFEGMRATLKAIMGAHPWATHIALACFFIGFSTKAGILPFGDWLPDAYPAAPSPASAAFAGGMSKLGVYGIVRIFCEILPVSEYTKIWGMVIALFGTLSIFVGTMTAMMQDDSKRLLSFHVIGQVGYMFLGVGAGIYFMATYPTIAMVALSAGLFHVLNNILYKSSLYLNAGSIFYKTGTRNLNEIGGLAKLMPWTAATAIIASFSIAGVPPFNGFSSKWLIYQSTIFGGIHIPVFMALAIVAIFISAVTLASFLKFFGASFYGKLRTPSGEAVPGDVPATMQISQTTLAALCILIGLMPLVPLRWIYRSVASLYGSVQVPAFAEIFGGTTSNVGLNFGGGLVANWHPVTITLVGLVLLVLSYGIYRSGRAPRRAVSTWYCGEPHAAAEVHFKAHSFYLPFKQMFRVRIGRHEWEGVYITIRYPEIRLRPDNWLVKAVDLDRWFFYPVVNGFYKVSEWFRRSHVGIPHVYLAWAILGVLGAIWLLFALH